MKKLLSLLIAVTAITTSVGSMAYAEDFEIDSAQIQISEEDSDQNKNASALQNLAVQLIGNDYFRFSGFISETTGELEFQTQYEKDGFITHMEECFGLSALQMLAHNGTISPSNISKGAKNLCDITLNKNVNDLVVKYTNLDNDFIHDAAYGNFHCNNTDAECAKALVSAAETAMKNKKFFLIKTTIPVDVVDIYGRKGENWYSHSIVGAGISTGNWTFDGKSYDKCIITVDTNAMNEKGTVNGFNEKYCIYVNSGTNEYCLPAYKLTNTTSPYRLGKILGIITDDATLNYGGAINPSTTYDSALSKIKEIGIYNTREAAAQINIVTNGKTETFTSQNGEIISGMTKRDYDLVDRNTRTIVFREADSISFKASNVTLINKDNPKREFGISMEDVNGGISFAGGDGKGSAVSGEISRNKISFQNIDKQPDGFSIHYTDKTNSNNGTISVWSDSYDGNATITFEKDGVIIDSNKNFGGWVSLNDRKHDPKDIGFNISSEGKVKVCIDEKTGEMYAAIGKDFSQKVARGDVNCDGVVNSVDASIILKSYSAEQTGGWAFATDNVSDMNNDGTVNAIDASAVLAEYAKNQVK